MGTWGAKPWENDDASAWFDDFLDVTGIRDYVINTIHEEIDTITSESLQRIRAATCVFIMLGRSYIWPPETRKEDLALVLEKYRQLRDKTLEFQSPAISAMMDCEISILQRRYDFYVVKNGDRTGTDDWFCKDL
jgi:hypothetical protein